MHNLINLKKSVSFFPECLTRLVILFLNDSGISGLPSIIQAIHPGLLPASFELRFWPLCRAAHCISLYVSVLCSSLQNLH